jgi:formamidopyrimidine-DNA glycosylase
MPELPEVETISRGLHKRVAGDKIDSVWIGDKREPLKSPAAEIVRVLEGSRIDKVARVGKHIVLSLSRRNVPGQWIVHLGMTGSMRVATPETGLAPHTHLIAKLASGKELRFVDPRRFGRLEVRETVFTGPGTEPLGIGLDEFAALFHQRQAPIKGALLNQKLLHGVGNIYADESLFRAKVRPRRRAGSLTRDELKKLHAGLQSTA